MESQPQNPEFRINPETFNNHNELRACFMMAFLVSEYCETIIFSGYFYLTLLAVKTKTTKYEIAKYSF